MDRSKMVRSQLDIAAQLLPSKPWRSGSFLPPKFFLIKNSFDGKNYSGATDWQKSAILPLLLKQITQVPPQQTHWHVPTFKIILLHPLPPPAGDTWRLFHLRTKLCQYCAQFTLLQLSHFNFQLYRKFSANYCVSDFFSRYLQTL